MAQLQEQQGVAMTVICSEVASKSVPMYFDSITCMHWLHYLVSI